MKVGDRLYCKSELGVTNWLTIGNIYRVNSIEIEDKYNITHFTIQDNLGDDLFFYLDTELTEFVSEYFANKYSTYFVTLRESRKLKLDKIEEK